MLVHVKTRTCDNVMVGEACQEQGNNRLAADIYRAPPRYWCILLLQECRYYHTHMCLMSIDVSNWRDKTTTGLISRRQDVILTFDSRLLRAVGKAYLYKRCNSLAPDIVSRHKMLRFTGTLLFTNTFSGSMQDVHVNAIRAPPYIINQYGKIYQRLIYVKRPLKHIGIGQ